MRHSKHQKWNWLRSYTQLNMQAYWSPKAVSLILLNPAWHHHTGESVTPGTACTGSCMFQLQYSVFLSSSLTLVIHSSVVTNNKMVIENFLLSWIRIAFFWCELCWARFQIYVQFRCNVIGEVCVILWKTYSPPQPNHLLCIWQNFSLHIRSVIESE